MNSSSRLILPEKLKYYAFDWDDNILIMATKIYLLLNWQEVGVSTRDFAHIRNNLWDSKDLIDQIKKWVHYILENWKSFRDFTVEWDKQFETDFMNATLWPSWDQFQECINNASIFSIITARWHSSAAMTKAIENMIFSWFEWLNLDQICQNMYNFMKLANNNTGNKVLTWDKELIDYYLGLSRMYPVSNNSEMEKYWISWSTISPEIAKWHSLLHFVNHITKKVDKLVPELYQRPKITVWFSDDDKKNVEFMKIFMEKHWLWEDILHNLFDTSSWESKKIQLLR